MRNPRDVAVDGGLGAPGEQKIGVNAGKTKQERFDEPET
jgi:hypothetical protein